jgi:ABC-type multidrug transport system fused ATPase/permease subunit
MAKYLAVYGILSLGSIILSLASHGLGQYAGSRARKTLHDSMLLNIVKCPVKLFESTPAGRMFNRFSTDLSVIDKVCELIESFSRHERISC